MSKQTGIGSIYEVSSCIGYLIKPLIGHSGCVKIVTGADGREMRYFRDAGLLLNNLEIKHPVGQYILSVSQGFRSHYKTGDDTLIYFIHAWIRAASELVQMGIETDCATTLMDTVLEECIDHVDAVKISLDDLLTVEKHCDQSTTDNVPTQQCLDNCKCTVSTGYCKLSHLTVSPDNYAADSNNSLKKRTVTENTFNNHLSCDQFNKTIEYNGKSNMSKTPIGSLNDNDFLTKPGLSMSSFKSKMFEEDGEENEFVTIQLDIDTEITAQKLNNADDYKDVEQLCNEMKDFLPEKSQMGRISHSDKLLNQGNVTSCLQETDCDETVEIIHLEMKTDETVEDDDFEWFFKNDIDQPSDEVISEHDDEITVGDIKVNGSLPELKQESRDLDTVHDDDIVAELESLKQNIENDIEQFRECHKRQVRRQSEKQYNKKDTEIGDCSSDFDDLFSESDDEFHNEFQCTNIIKEQKIEDFTDIQIAFSEICISHSNKADTIKLSEKNVACMQEIAGDKQGKEDEEGNFLQVNRMGLAKFEIEQNQLPSEISLFPVDNRDEPTEIHKVDSETNRNFNEVSSNMNDIQKMNIMLKNLKATGSKVPDTDTQPYSRHLSECTRNIDAEFKRKTNSVSVQNEIDSHIAATENTPVKAMENVDKELDIHIEENVHNSKEIIEKGKSTLLDESKELNVSDDIRSSETTETLMHSKHQRQNDSLKLDDLNGMLKRVQSLAVSHSQDGSLSRRGDFSIKSGYVLPEQDECNATSMDFPTENNGLLKKRTFVVKSRHLLAEPDIIGDINETNGHIMSSDEAGKDMESKLNIGENSEGHPEVYCNLTPLTCTETRQVNAKTDKSKIKPLCLKEAVAIRDDMMKNKIGSQHLRRVREIVYRLNPGVHPETAEVVTEYLQQKLTNKSCEPWYTEVYSNEGCHTEPRLINGVLLLTTLDNVESLHHLGNRTLRLLLVNGDIRPSYRHKGYKATQCTRLLTVKGLSQHKTPNTKWLMNSQQVLQKIDVVLARGVISDEFKDMCHHCNVVAMETIAYKHLKQISEAAQREMITYVSLATEINIVEDVSITPVNPHWSDINVFCQSKLQQLEVVVTIASKHMKTITITEPTFFLADLKDQEVCQCVHRVNSVLNSGHLTPAVGRIEEMCANICRLAAERTRRNLDTFQDTQSFIKPVVYTCMEQCFIEYKNIVQKNLNYKDTGSQSVTDCFYDDYTAKIASWRAAMEAVKVIMKMDVHVTTGLTDDCVRNDREKPVF